MRARTTYRSERRNEWRRLNQWLAGAGAVPWDGFNGRAPKYQLGTLPAQHRPAAANRSKYMPHIGSKERGRYAA